MSLRQQLAQLEVELDRVEEQCFDGNRPNGAPSEAWTRRAELVERIIAIEREVNPDVRQDLEADREAQRHNGLGWHERKREETLRREWEQWRHRRSKLPADRRPAMMKLGERECRFCGGYFEPTTLRQRACSESCRKAAHKRKGA